MKPIRPKEQKSNNTKAFDFDDFEEELDALEEELSELTKANSGDVDFKSIATQEQSTQYQKNLKEELSETDSNSDKQEPMIETPETQKNLEEELSETDSNSDKPEPMIETQETQKNLEEKLSETDSNSDKQEPMIETQETQKNLEEGQKLQFSAPFGSSQQLSIHNSLDPLNISSYSSYMFPAPPELKKTSKKRHYDYDGDNQPEKSLKTANSPTGNPLNSINFKGNPNIRK